MQLNPMGNSDNSLDSVCYDLVWPIQYACISFFKLRSYQTIMSKQNGIPKAQYQISKC